MYRQVPGKRQQIVDTLARRIRDGHYRPGDKLDGELRLAEEFDVSRGTVRQALSELQHLRLISTETGRGSFVIFDGHQLSQDRGWAQSLASTGSQITVAVLGIERVQRSDVPLLPDEVRLEQGIAIRRVRLLRSADSVEPISFECSTVPADGRLAELPETGLIQGSISQTLVQAGYLSTRGTQRADVHPLDEREAEILRHDAGTVFLRTARTSFTDDGRFAEHVVSLLDPRYFTLAHTFGDER
ncbi:GntR family transcriptional regulator [Saccharopolyspora gloriosae]|uniref:GntR family transcriptional regulator n=1 Tax=Saccharopolyspora gloriosae TaxID=455344 RepID=UPI001FB72653|nr:GntR family transcriptional regulator [Saccharopolyspora gloriosae]